MTINCQTCNKCELSKFSNKKIIYRTVGKPPFRYIFIGEAPGLREYLDGKPFVGMSGTLLGSLLEEVMGDNSYLITNSVLCTPFEDASRTNIVEPTKQQKDACRAWLHELLVITKPEIIFTLGLHALRTVNKIKTPARIVKLMHPSAILQSKQRELDERKFVVTIREYMSDKEETS